MRRVPADEDPPVAEPVGHQPPADPVFLGQHLELEVGTHAEQAADAGLAVHRLEVELVRQQVVVDQPGLTPVDGH